MTFVDSHCHFDFAAFDLDRAVIWQACQQRGISALIIPGITPEQWPVAAQISQQYAGIFWAAAIHPWWLETLVDGELNSQQIERFNGALRQALTAQKCVAIGECGLDAMIKVPMSIQLQVLALHLQLASELRLPLMIHCRKAHNELMVLLKQYSLPAGGVIHGFSGSIDLANCYWALGFRLGIGGSITYERAHKTRTAVTQIAIEAILLETDAPDMPLSGKQGQRNSPEYLPLVAETLAILRGETVAYIAAKTTQNTRLLFGLLAVEE